MPEREIGAISIGISANIRDLEEDLARANSVISSHRLPADKTYKVKINTNEVKTGLQRAQEIVDQTSLVLRNFRIQPNASTIREMRRGIEQGLQHVAGAPIHVPVSAEKSAQGLRKEIVTAIGGPIDIEITWHYGPQGPPPTGGAPSGGPGPSRGPTGGSTGPTGAPAAPTGGTRPRREQAGPVGPLPGGGTVPATPIPAVPTPTPRRRQTATATGPTATAPVIEPSPPPPVAPPPSGTRGTGGQTRPGRASVPVSSPVAPTPELTSMIQGAGGYYVPGIGIAARSGSPLATQGVTYEGQTYSLEDIQKLYQQRQVPASFRRATEAEQNAAIEILNRREIAPLTEDQKKKILEQGLGPEFQTAMAVLSESRSTISSLPKRLKPEDIARRGAAEAALSGVQAGAQDRLRALKEESIDAARKTMRDRAGRHIAEREAAGEEWSEEAKAAEIERQVSLAFPKTFMRAVAAKPTGGERINAYTMKVLANRVLLADIQSILNPAAANRPSANTMAHPSAGRGGTPSPRQRTQLPPELIGGREEARARSPFEIDILGYGEPGSFKNITDRAMYDPEYAAELARKLRGRAGGGKIKADPSKIGKSPVDDRFHHTYAWRQASIQQRAKQRWCTYCGTLGTSENPLQGEHFRPVALGGAGLDPKNITTSCKNCNLRKLKSLDWMPPGRADGGSVEGVRPTGGPGFFMRQIAAKGDPGIHEESGMSSPEEDMVSRYIVARDESGQALGRLLVTQTAQGYLGAGKTVGVHPFVLDEHRRKGIGTKLYQYAEKLGLDVERVSRENYESHFQTGVGRAFFEGRRRAGGGQTGPRPYLVGERGSEIFIPEQSGWIIPHHLMDQLPKRADGGPTEYLKNVPKIRPIGGGGVGPYDVRMGLAGARAEAAGTASAIGGMRVFVTNWPPTFGAGLGARTTAGGQGPFGFNTEAEAAEWWKSIGGTMREGWEAETSGATGGTTAAGGAGPKKKAEPGPILSETELTRARIKALEESFIDRQRRALQAAGIASSLAQAAVRSAGPATGEALATTLGGRAGIVQRAKIAQFTTAEAQRARTLESGLGEERLRAQVGLAIAQRTGNQKAIEEYTASITDLSTAEGVAAEYGDRLDQQAVVLGKNVATTSDKFKVFGTNIAGIAIGTTIFSAALAVLQHGMVLTEHVIAPAAERLTGFWMTTNRVTGALSDQERQFFGHTQVVIASAAAHAGLSDVMTERLNRTLQERVEFEAGNKAFMEQLDLIRTMQNVRGGLGALTPPGGIPGLSRATGGFMGSPLFAVPSLAEQLANEAGGGLNPDITNIGRQIQGLGIPILQTPLTDAIDKLTGFSASQVNIQNPATWGSSDVFGKFLDTRSKFEDVALSLTENAKKVGSTFALLDVHGRENADGLIEASRKSLISAGFSEDQADQLGNLGYAVVDATNGLDKLTEASSNTARQLLASAERGALVPTAAQLLAQNEPARRAQRAAIEMQSQMQLTRFLPAQRFVEFAGARPLPFGAGLTPVTAGGGLGPSAGGQFGGPDPAAIASFNKYQQAATEALEVVRTRAEAGRAVLRQMGVPPELITQLEGLGSQAAGIQLDVANQQARNSARQYNHELYIANRSLADALALAGKRAGAEGEIGKLQRQQVMNQRESQRLAFALQQRQINFQQALAGFEVPGLTPEEQAARVKQAQIEADVAQRQLNLQKKGFTIDISIFNASNRRQIEDLRFALSDLQQTHQVQLDAEAANQTITAIQKRIVGVSQEISVAIAKDEAKVQQSISEAVQIVSVTGDAFGTILGQTARAWNVFISQGVTAVSYLTKPERVPGETTLGGGRASGFLGSVSAPTSFTVGEAGPETVIVLRNARSTMAGGGMGMGGGGSPVSFTINIDARGASVDENALGVWKEAIVRDVTKAIGRTLSLTGQRLG